MENYLIVYQRWQQREASQSWSQQPVKNYRLTYKANTTVGNFKLMMTTSNKGRNASLAKHLLSRKQTQLNIKENQEKGGGGRVIIVLCSLQEHEKEDWQAAIADISK